MADVVVVGGAGQTGRCILNAVRARGGRARAMVRHEGRRELVIAAGAAEVALGDLEDPASLRGAFTGARSVLLIPPLLNLREAVLVANALDAAEASGVQRFVYYSVLHPHTPALPHHMRKAQAELAVRASSRDWTILQPAMYAQTVLLYQSKVDPTAVHVPWAANRRLSLVDLHDIAEAAAITALEDGHHFATYELAGPQALSMHTAVEQLGSVLGAPLRAIASTARDFQAPPTWSSSAVQDVRAMFAEYDQHGLLGNPTVLRALLGREPTAFVDVMRRTASTPDHPV